MLKKALSLVLVLAVAVLSVPIISLPRAFASDWQAVLTYETNSDNTGIIITECDDSASGILEIPSQINGLPVISIGDEAFYRCSSLTSVIIPDTVTRIGVLGFSLCSITSVVIGNGVTDLELYAFYYCDKLTSISLPDSVVNIGPEAFRGCSAIVSITFGSGVKNIGMDAITLCASLTSINVSAENQHFSSVDGVLFDKSKTTLVKYPDKKSESYTVPNGVTSISYNAFAYSSSLTGITIPNTVTSIDGYAFAYCSSLTSISLPDSVTSIGLYAFYDTPYYKNSSNWEDGVLYIGNCLIEAKAGQVSSDYSIKPGTVCIAVQAFGDCPLTSITIPGSVKVIGSHAFRGCNSLTEVTIPDGVVSIGADAFFYSTSITKVTIPDSVTSIGYEAFMGCSSLTDITFGNGLTSIGHSVLNDSAYSGNPSNWEDCVLYVDNYLIKANNSVLGGDYAIKPGTLCIADRAFWNTWALEAVDIPESLKAVGEGAFVGCSLIKNIKIPKSVEKIGEHAFGYSYADGAYEKYDDFVVYCYTNSAGEDYAISNGFEYVNFFELVAGSSLVIDDDNKTLISWSDNLKVSELINELTCDNAFIYKNDVLLEDGEIVSTGCEVRLVDGNTVLNSLTVIIKGDVTGDGKVKIDDVRKILRVAVELESFESNFQECAADTVTTSRKISIEDVRLALRVAVGLQEFSITTDIATNEDASIGTENDGLVTVTLTADAAGAEIYYTLDGTQPTADSTKYTVPFTLNTDNPDGETITVKAIAIKAGYAHSHIAQKEVVFKAIAISTGFITYSSSQYLTGQSFSVYASGTTFADDASALNLENWNIDTGTTNFQPDSIIRVSEKELQLSFVLKTAGQGSGRGTVKVQAKAAALTCAANSNIVKVTMFENIIYENTGEVTDINPATIELYYTNHFWLPIAPEEIAISEFTFNDDGVAMEAVFNGNEWIINKVPEFAGGDGTVENPYKVANSRQLNNVRKYLNASFEQIADIDLEAFLSENGEGYNDGKCWEPIGSEILPFTGSFDGKGFVISNLEINLPNLTHVGLFGENKGTIRNASLSNVNVTGRWYVGALIGNNSGGSITDCNMSGIVNGTAGVTGGLIGFSPDGGSISGCFSTGSVYAPNSHYVGGLIGGLYYGSLTESYSTCSVIGGDYYVGGLLGSNYESFVSKCFATGSVTGVNAVGGLSGDSMFGGIFINCYATGAVYGSDMVGGLVGDNYGTYEGSYSQIINSYSKGHVTGTTKTGGLVGRNENGATVTNSYWDTDASGQAASAGGSGFPTYNMIMESNGVQIYVDWDFTNTWAIKTDPTSYPYLLWQGEENVPYHYAV